jgi:hypothetical protein
MDKKFVLPCYVMPQIFDMNEATWHLITYLSYLYGQEVRITLLRDATILKMYFILMVAETYFIPIHCILRAT